MKPASARLISRLGVLLPTLALGFYLGRVGMGIGQRIFLTLMFGYLLIKAFNAWQRAVTS